MDDYDEGVRDNSDTGNPSSAISIYILYIKQLYFVGLTYSNANDDNDDDDKPLDLSITYSNANDDDDDDDKPLDLSTDNNFC